MKMSGEASFLYENMVKIAGEAPFLYKNSMKIFILI
jgi:hypothetical protein